MSLKKQTVVDRIEVVENGCVQVRTATRILENGTVISQTFHRHVVVPGQNYSTEDAKVQSVCAALHTAEVVQEYQAAAAAARAQLNQGV